MDEHGLLGTKPIDSLIEVNHKLALIDGACLNNAMQ